MGIPELNAHLGVVYWGMASFITPPVCIAVYVACGISGGDVWRTGWKAMRIGVAANIVPFSFILNSALLSVGKIETILFGVITAVLGAVAVASGLNGYLFARLNLWQRGLMSIGGILLILPGLYNALFGAAAIGVVIITTLIMRKKDFQLPI